MSRIRQHHRWYAAGLRACVGWVLLLCAASVYGQDYWEARDLLTRFSDAWQDENELEISALMTNVQSQAALTFVANMPWNTALEDDFAFSECKVDYQLMKKGGKPSDADPRITVQFREVPKGVWERFWVVDNVYDQEGNPLADKGFALNSTNGNFTELSDQVRDITTSDFLGLAPYGKLNRSYLLGREFRTDLKSTKLTFNNIQIRDSTGRILDYVYVTLGYLGYPQGWYIMDLGPMSQRWIGRDRYVDFLMGQVDSLLALQNSKPAGQPIKPVLVQWMDTTLLQGKGDTTFFAQSPTQFDTLYYQVAGEKNAFSVGRSSQFLNMRLYPLNHTPEDTSTAPRERGALALGLSGGLNRSFATLLRDYSPGNVYSTQGPGDYSGGNAWQVALDARYQFLPRISASVEVGYLAWTYSYQDQGLFSDPDNGLGQWLQTQYKERIGTLSLNAYGRYELRKVAEEGAAADAKPKAVTWIPYGEVGAGYNLILSADAALSETSLPGAGTQDNDPQTAKFEYSVKGFRKTPYVTPSVGIGLRMETRHSDFWAVLRFRPLTWTLVDYDDPKDRSLFPLSQGFYHMDDDFALNQFSLSVGYAFVFKKKE
ncbi:MAG: hypothetical protein U0176_21940 [Bacteroidia bacterium]